MVFRHNTADEDLAGAICLDPRLKNGACHFRAVLLTWHFDSFHIHWFPLRISPLRFLENIREFELQVMYPRRIYGALLERQPALTDRPNDGENITMPLPAWALRNRNPANLEKARGKCVRIQNVCLELLRKLPGRAPVGTGLKERLRNCASNLTMGGRNGLESSRAGCWWGCQ
jgi:hypothetical protein